MWGGSLIAVFRVSFATFQTARKRPNTIRRGNLRMQVAYAYILIKDKNTKKIRPIVSYRLHPYRKIFNIIARAISFMVSTIKIKHCNLEKCDDLKPTLEAFASKANRRFGQSTRFAYMIGDIKNMYTELKHNKIIFAIDWIIEKFKEITRLRQPTLSMPKHGTKGVYIGRTTTTSEIFVSLSEIRKVVIRPK